MCPWNARFAEVAAERDYAARLPWGAEWPASDDDEDGPRRDSLVPDMDGPWLVALMRMDEDEWDAFTRGSAIRRAGYSGFMRNVAIRLKDLADLEALGE